MMNKHAYLILAHKNLEQLKLLVNMLDSKKNDIYIHIDTKCEEFNENFKIITRYSNVKIFCVIDVKWGDYSIVAAELLLLKESLKNKYSYFHLISGEDLPIKNNDYIYNFFEKSNKEFVFFTQKNISHKDLDRIYYYHIMLGKLRTSKHNFINRIYFFIDNVFVILQKIFLLKKKKILNNYQRGSQWFSITSGFAKYIIQNENLIYTEFKNTLIPDEMVLQSLLINSKWINNLYVSDSYNECIQNMRLIDWNRGNPYVFSKKDFEEIRKSDMLFARKFDIKMDSEIINLIGDCIKND